MTAPAATGPSGGRSYEVPDPSLQLRGGYGVVFQAVLVDDHLGEDRRGMRVSLKMLSGADEDRWAKLVSRSPELASLCHRNLVAHLEVFDGHPLARAVLGPDEPTHHWMVNEWVPGQPLADADVGMPVTQLLALFAGAAEAVDFLHAAGVAHRDLHPRNLILTDDKRLVVIDYDTALTAGSTSTTRTLAGTQFSADLPAPARDDPFAADTVAFARCVVHVLARDADGALDLNQALEKALGDTSQDVADPERFADLLQAGVGGWATGCASWIQELRRSIVEEGPGRARRRRQATHRKYRIVLVTVLVAILPPSIKFDLPNRILKVVSGDLSPMQIVAIAGENTARQGTFSVDILIDFGATDSDTELSPIRGSIDLIRKTGTMTAALEDFGVSGGGRVDAVRVGALLYVTTQRLRELFPDAAPWIRLDSQGLTAPNSTASDNLERLGALDDSGQIATAVFLAAYFFGSTNEFLSDGLGPAISGAIAVGREPVRSALTTRYRLVLKPGLVNSVFDELRGEVGEMSAEVWVDGDGRLRRLQYNTGSPEQGRSIHEFFGFGSQFDIKVPRVGESSTPEELLAGS